MGLINETWINKAMVCICDRERWLLNRRKRGTAVDQELSGARGSYNADHGLVLTRSGSFGLHTPLGSDFFPTDNDSDNER